MSTFFSTLPNIRMPYADNIIVGHIIKTVKNPIETDCRYLVFFSQRHIVFHANHLYIRNSCYIVRCCVERATNYSK